MPIIPINNIDANPSFSGFDSFGTISINGITNAKTVKSKPVIKIAQPDATFTIFLESVVFVKISIMYVGINDERVFSLNIFD